MSFIKNLHNFIEDPEENAALSKEEKAEMRSKIIQFMKANPIEAKAGQPIAVFAWTNLFARPALKYASLMSCLLIFFGCIGVSFAAQQSLPGDSLYPVKTHINEEVLSWISFTNEAKAAYNVKLVQRRLEEIEKVAARGKLSNEANEKAHALLNKRIAKTNALTKKASGANPSFPAAVHSELEASLFAHGYVLENLADRDERDEISRNIRKATEEVKQKIKEAKKAREESELQVAQKPSEEIKNSTDENLQKVERSIMAAKKALDGKKGFLTAKNYEIAIKNLLEAENTLSLSKKDLKNGNYGKAFVASQKAMRVVYETNIGIDSLLELNVNILDGTSVNREEWIFTNPENEADGRHMEIKSSPLEEIFIPGQ